MGKREKLYHDSFWEVLMSSDVTVLETEFCCICKSAVRQELIFFFSVCYRKSQLYLLDVIVFRMVTKPLA